MARPPATVQAALIGVCGSILVAVDGALDPLIAVGLDRNSVVLELVVAIGVKVFLILGVVWPISRRVQ